MILLPGPTEPRFWFLLWGSLFAGIIGAVILAFVVRRS